MITKRTIKCADGQFAVEVPWNVPSKKNSYEIHFSPALWKLIQPIIKKVKKTQKLRRPYWISPTRRVKQFEKDLSTWFALYLPDFGTAPLSLEIFVNQKNDVDNIAGAILDALEKSRRINNDRQIESVTVRRSQTVDEPIVFVSEIQKNGGIASFLWSLKKRGNLADIE